MPLDPLVKVFLDQLAATPRPKSWEMTPSQARAGFRATMKLFGPRDVAIGKTENMTIPGPAGGIAIRIYTPVAAGGEALPALVFYHGGCFITGDFETHEGCCRVLAGESGCRVIAVDYRLGPEHKFPAAVDDAYAAAKWIETNASALGVDANRIAVGGDSAGGNLAAVVCQLARTEAGPKIAYQILMFPMTQFGEMFASLREYATGYLFEKQAIDWTVENYLPPGVDVSDARLSPLLAEDLSGSPPAYVLLAGCDPLHDEGLAYAEKLRNAGVAVTIDDYAGMLHCFVHFQAVLPQAREALIKVAKALRTRFEAL
jgi:acetyl esterase/lipase